MGFGAILVIEVGALVSWILISMQERKGGRERKGDRERERKKENKGRKEEGRGREGEEGREMRRGRKGGRKRKKERKGGREMRGRKGGEEGGRKKKENSHLFPEQNTYRAPNFLKHLGGRRPREQQKERILICRTFLCAKNG